ncbi:MAG: hypothetical protein AB1Z20_02625 [Desulfobacterales bacterium]
MPKYVKAIILLAAVAGLTVTVSFAERIYHWTDKSGVDHLTQHPPPAEGQLNDIMDYTSSDRKPAKVEREARRQDDDESEEPLQSGSGAYRSEKMEEAVEANNYCFLQAPDIDLYVRVWEPDSYGGRGPKLWSGVISKNQQQKIASSSGRVIYDYQKEYKGPFGGNRSSNCSGGGVIRLLR